MKNEIKLIILDIDECVTSFWKNHLDLESMAKLQEYCLAMNGNNDFPKVILSSGRQVPYAEVVVQMLGIFSGYPSVLEAGAMLYYPIIRKTIVNPNISEEIINAFVKIRPIIKELIDFGANKEVGKELCISLNPPTDQSIEDLFKNVCGKLNGFREWVSITHSKTAVDITPINIDKSSSINILEKETGINRNDMLSIGDSNGDLSTMALTGFVACPFNASCDVKNLVLGKNGYISNFPETKGIVDIFEQLILK